MAKYLTNKETQAALEKIIIGAEKKLILVSPYIKLTKLLLARIKTIADKGVEVKIVFRVDGVKEVEFDRLKSIKDVELKSIDDLHAKCYFNEKEMIITSLNLLDTSEKNWEMGIYINRKDDKDIFDAAYNDVLTIYKDSQTQKFPQFYNEPALIVNKPKINSKTKIEDISIKIPSKGYCITCEDKIRFDIDKPFCRDCFEEWEEDDIENFCHACGKDEDTERYKPLCYSCYKKYYKQ